MLIGWPYAAGQKMFSLAGGDTFPHFPASALVPAGVAKWNPRSWSANLGPSLHSCIMFEPPYLTDIQALRPYVFGQTYCRFNALAVASRQTALSRLKTYVPPPETSALSGGISHLDHQDGGRDEQHLTEDQ
jgi:hypothetical protein